MNCWKRYTVEEFELPKEIEQALDRLTPQQYEKLDHFLRFKIADTICDERKMIRLMKVFFETFLAYTFEQKNEMIDLKDFNIFEFPFQRGVYRIIQELTDAEKIEFSEYLVSCLGDATTDAEINYFTEYNCKPFIENLREGNGK